MMDDQLGHHGGKKNFMTDIVTKKEEANIHHITQEKHAHNT